MSDRHIMIVAGEASGDLHAANVVRAIRDAEPDWRFSGFGGAELRAAGVDLQVDLVDRSVMGIRAVIGSFASIVDVAALFLEQIDRDRPDAVVLVDYPGLNLNLARMARRRGIPVIYYICPQVWAWAPWRVRRIAARADMLLVIIPFEQRIYERVHPQVHYVGHPLFDHLVNVEAALGPRPDSRETLQVGIFPGSRRQEVKETLPAMLRIARSLARERETIHFRVSCHRGKLEPGIRALVESCELPIEVVPGDSQRLARDSDLTLVVSGTVTLEQAFFGTPMVIMYPARALEIRLFELISTTPFIGLVNLFAGREVVPEFLFSAGDEERVERAALSLLDREVRNRTRDSLRALREEAFHLGGATRAAERIIAFLGAT